MSSRPVCNLYMLSSMMIGPKHAYRILRQDMSMVEIQNQTKVWETLKSVLRLVEIREEVTWRRSLLGRLQRSAGEKEAQ